jgi:chromosome partitioning protein
MVLSGMATMQDASDISDLTPGRAAQPAVQGQEPPQTGDGQPAQVVVVGNEKGGSGKTTTAMHLIVALLHAGRRVASIDVDSRQASLTRFLANRSACARKQDIRLPMSEHGKIGSDARGNPLSLEDANVQFDGLLAEFVAASDFVVIDTPSSDSGLSRHAHSHADTLITPLNDSFIDLDVLATTEAETQRILHPSQYAEMVWEQKKERARRDGGSIDWVIMQNRLSSLDSPNKQAMVQAVSLLSKRIAFRVVPGFTERVIFRELFLKGLTLLDLREPGGDIKLNISHIAGRQEVRGLIESLRFPTPLQSVDAARDIRRNTAPAFMSDG